MTDRRGNDKKDTFGNDNLEGRNDKKGWAGQEKVGMTRRDGHNRNTYTSLVSGRDSSINSETFEISTTSGSFNSVSSPLRSISR